MINTELSKEDKDRINSWINEGRRRFGNNLHDVEIFCLGCIHAETTLKEIQNE